MRRRHPGGLVEGAHPTDRLRGRWTIKRGRRAKPPEGTQREVAGEVAVPVFGHKNRLGIYRRHGFTRRFVVTDIARHDGSQLCTVLDTGDTSNGVPSFSAPSREGG